MDQGRRNASERLSKDASIVDKKPITKWEEEQEKLLKTIECHRNSGYYEGKTDAAIKDCTDLYVARIICYQAANTIG